MARVFSRGSSGSRSGAYTDLGWSRREVQDWAEDLDEAFLTCRDIGHSWRPHVARFDRGRAAYIRTLRCQRCDTERSQVVDLRGGIVSGSYDYPDGYQAPKGAGRISGDGRGALRLISTLRLIEG